jgi:hypothetical protein
MVINDKKERDEKLRKNKTLIVFPGSVIEIDAGARSFIGGSVYESIVNSENDSPFEDFR